MAAGDNVKCAYCGKYFNANKTPSAKPSSTRYAHKECYENHLKEEEEKKKIAEEKKKLKEESKKENKPRTTRKKKIVETSSSDEQNLRIYIKELFGYPNLILNPKINAQIREFVDEYEYTYTGIHSTLYYFYEIQKNSIEDANGGIGIVPWVYQEAKKYYEGINSAIMKNFDKNVKDYTPTVDNVIIPIPEVGQKKRKIFTFLDEEDI